MLALFVFIMPSCVIPLTCVDSCAAALEFVSSASPDLAFVISVMVVVVVVVGEVVRGVVEGVGRLAVSGLVMRRDWADMVIDDDMGRWLMGVSEEGWEPEEGVG